MIGLLNCLNLFLGKISVDHTNSLFKIKKQLVSRRYSDYIFG